MNTETEHNPEPPAESELATLRESLKQRDELIGELKVALDGSRALATAWAHYYAIQEHRAEPFPTHAMILSRTDAALARAEEAENKSPSPEPTKTEVVIDDETASQTAEAIRATESLPSGPEDFRGEDFPIVVPEDDIDPRFGNTTREIKTGKVCQCKIPFAVAVDYGYECSHCSLPIHPYSITRDVTYPPTVIVNDTRIKYCNCGTNYRPNPKLDNICMTCGGLPF